MDNAVFDLTIHLHDTEPSVVIKQFDTFVSVQFNTAGGGNVDFFFRDMDQVRRLGNAILGAAQNPTPLAI